MRRARRCDARMDHATCREATGNERPHSARQTTQPAQRSACARGRLRAAQRPLDRSIATDRPIAWRTNADSRGGTLGTHRVLVGYSQGHSRVANERSRGCVGGYRGGRARALHAEQRARALLPRQTSAAAQRTATRRDTVRRTMLMLCSLSATNLSRQMRKFENAVFHCAPNPDRAETPMVVSVDWRCIIGRL